MLLVSRDSWYTFTPTHNFCLITRIFISHDRIYKVSGKKATVYYMQPQEITCKISYIHTRKL